MHMISKKDLSDEEMDTLRKSCSPTTVITANGEVQTHDEATVYVKELDVLDFECEWINGQKPHLILKRDSNTMLHGELRSYRGSRLVSEFVLWFLSVNFKDTFKTGEALLYIFVKLVLVTDSNIK